MDKDTAPPLHPRPLDLEPGSGAGPEKARELLFTPEYVDNLSMSRIIENLYMISTGIRHASMFHPIDIGEVLLVHKAAKSLSIGMRVRKAGSRVLKVFLFDDSVKDKADRIPDIDESMGRMQFITAQITLANFTGHFLDFPRCCIESFVRHLMNATDQDAEASRQLNECSNPLPEAYFVERFVPCSPECPNASAEGRRIEKALALLDDGILAKYLKLRADHMEDVRLGRIVREKRERDGLLDGR